MTGTILLVEDDRQLRRSLATALRKGGFEVDEAPLGALALERLASAEPPVDLVITDVSLWPGGTAGLREAVERHPGEPGIVYMSGYERSVLLERDLIPRGAELVRKPFAPFDLVRRAEEAMAGGG